MNLSTHFDSPGSTSGFKRLHNLAVARKLATAGIFLFPARVFYNQRTGKWEKVPCIKNWRAKASTDLDQIARWWREYPDAVAGIELGRSKLVAIDPDRHGGPDGVAAFGELEMKHGRFHPHPQSQTPGGGEHHFFRQPDNQPLGNRTGALPAGIDVRGAGGWAVGPGSVRADGKKWEAVAGAPSLAEAYSTGDIPVISDWLVAIIRATPRRPPPIRPSTAGANGARHPTQSSSREAIYARQALRGIADELRRTPPNTHRNECLNAGAYRMGRMVARAWIDKADVADELTEAALASGLDVDEVQGTLASGLTAGMAVPAEDLQDRPRVVNGHAPQQLDTADWPDPVALPTSLLSVAPFDFAMLPEKMCAWVRDVAERMQCPPDYVAATVMVGLGTVIGRKLALRPKLQDDWSVVPNLWGLCIGSPGVLKTPSQNEGLRHLRALGAAAREAFNMAKAEYDIKATAAKARTENNKKEVAKKLAKDSKAIIDDLLTPQLPDGKEPTCKRYITTNATYEALAVVMQQNPNGILVDRDEALSLLDRLDEEGHADERGFYLSGWSGDCPYTVDRIGRGLDLHVDAVCISMIGGTQPARISQYLTQVKRGGRGNDGLIQRFGLMVWPDISPSWTNVDRKPDSDAAKVAFRVFQTLDEVDWRAIGGKRDQGVGGDDEGLPYLRLSQDAHDLFVVWRTELEHRLRQGELDPMMESHLAKYRKLVPGLALIIHLADGGTGEVGTRAVEKALKWAAYLETHVARTYASTSIASADAARAILAKIRSGHLKDRFGSRDVWRPGWSLLRDRDTVQAALQLLVDFDWLSVATVMTGGRSATVYTPNPKGFAAPNEP